MIYQLNDTGISIKDDNILSKNLYTITRLSDQIEMLHKIFLEIHSIDRWKWYCWLLKKGWKNNWTTEFIHSINTDKRHPIHMNESILQFSRQIKSKYQFYFVEQGQGNNLFITLKCNISLPKTVTKKAYWSMRFLSMTHAKHFNLVNLIF